GVQLPPALHHNFICSRQPEGWIHIRRGGRGFNSPPGYITISFAPGSQRVGFISASADGGSNPPRATSQFHLLPAARGLDSYPPRRTGVQLPPGLHHNFICSRQPEGWIHIRLGGRGFNSPPGYITISFAPGSQRVGFISAAADGG